ncbi:thermonuclease family protein [Microbacterium sp. No. 7]|uniref:thermonuclease family protein n=1 Tax=Microbacterium sp. No. 7 TaxID=1714373 RepID=UPI0006D1024D|nr:thermonuclease family protein [Microbacterium sp. No. 7]
MRRTRALAVAGILALALAVALTAAIVRHASAPEIADAGASATQTATVEFVVDGDTIATSAGRVRIIGIDAPERDQCGHAEATAALEGFIAPGDPVTLELPAGQNDRDRHDRLLRHVVTGAGVDLGLAQLEAGHAVARYDSRDGYPAHPHEDEYRAAQRKTSPPSISPDCPVM